MNQHLWNELVHGFRRRGWTDEQIVDWREEIDQAADAAGIAHPDWGYPLPPPEPGPEPA